jgi:hypothetical protein
MAAASKPAPVGEEAWACTSWTIAPGPLEEVSKSGIQAQERAFCAGCLNALEILVKNAKLSPDELRAD